MASWLSKQLGRAISNVGTAYKLPEMGFSEKFGYSPPKPIGPESGYVQAPSGKLINANQVNIRGSSYPGAPNAFGNMSSLSQGSVLGRNIDNSGGNSGGGGQPDYSQINQNTEDYNAIIDQEYNNQMDVFNTQEAQMKAQGATAGATAESGAAKTKTAYEQEGQTKIGAQEQNIQTGQTNAATAMQQARDLFRQTQQSNIAQLSALGISSSSVAEAMAETLGVETARRIAGATGSLNDIVQNATKEIGNIRSWVATKKSEVENDLAIKKDEIQAWMNNQISTINNARNQAATAKAQQRLELFTNAQELVANLTSQYQDYQAKLDQWAAQKANSISQFTNTEGIMNAFNSAMSNLSSQFSPTQYDITGNLNYNQNSGYYPTYSVKSKKTTEEDELANPFM